MSGGVKSYGSIIHVYGRRVADSTREMVQGCLSSLANAAAGRDPQSSGDLEVVHVY